MVIPRGVLSLPCKIILTMDKENVARIAISLPPKLLTEFDGLIDRMGYANRSEAIRDAVRHYMTENAPTKEKGLRIGIISILYDHDKKGVSDVLTDLQHKYHSLIQSSIHIHLDAHNCMELVIAKGDVKKITEIKDRLTTVSGVKHTDLILSEISEHEHTH
jgi:CopG family nickel-responsive transcriptional regulator